MILIQEGLAIGDGSFHIVDPKHRADQVRNLEEAGIDVADAESKGQLEVHAWQEAYIKNDRFDQYRMIDLFKEAIACVQDLLEYESRLNVSRFDARVVIDIMRTHTNGNHRRDFARKPLLCAAGSDAEKIEGTKGGESRRLIQRSVAQKFCMNRT